MYICGGFNVYPAEIEQVLARLDGVAEAAVIGVPDDRLGEVGKAFVVHVAGRRARRADRDRPTRASISRTSRPRGRSSSSTRCRVTPEAKWSNHNSARSAKGPELDLDFDDATARVPGRGARVPRREPRLLPDRSPTTPPRASSSTAAGTRCCTTRGLSVITWPERYGGRDATLLQWIVYEEEYFRAGAPGRASANGTSMLAPTLFAHGTEEQRRPRAAENGQRRGDLGAGVVGAGVGERPGLVAFHGDQDRRRLAAQRPEDLEFPRSVRRAGVRAVPLRSGGAAAQGLDVRHVRPEGRRRDGAPDRPARRRHRVRGDLPRRRLRPRRGRDRRGARRLARRDEHLEQRTRHVAAQPGAVPRARRTPGRTVEEQSRPGVHRPRRRRVDQGAGLPVAHVRDCHPAWRAAASWARSRRSPRCSGPISTSRCTRPRWICAAPTANSTGPVTEGLLFALGGPIYAGTNEIQRNIIAERLLGLPRK